MDNTNAVNSARPHDVRAGVFRIIPACCSNVWRLSLLALATWPLHAAATAETPVQVELTYDGDVFGALTGGLSGGVSYADLLAGSIEMTAWEAGDDSLRFLISGLHANGAAPTGDLFGDAQTVSNLETGFETTRVNETWLEYISGKLSVKAGLYDLNSEFDSLDASGLFLNASHGVGLDISQSGPNGPSIFPFTGLGLRTSYSSGAHTARVAVLDASPGVLDDPRRLGFDLRAREGALAVGEWEFRPGEGKLLTGAWVYSEAAELVAAPGQSRRSNSGFYMRGETAPRAFGQGTMSVFGRVGYANDDFNAFDGFASAGAVWTGLHPARPEDQLGLALAYGRLGEAQSRAQRVLGGDPAEGELNMELTWRALLTQRFAIQPNLQFITSPSADRAASDVLAAGVRLSIDLSP